MTNVVEDQLLENAGIKPNRYRLELLRFLKGSREHATAETIYQSLSGKFPDISFATVYNNLNLFYKQHLVRRFYTSERETRYDWAGTPHHHFICQQCSRVEDLPADAITLTVNPDLARTLRIQGTETLIYGTCASCRPQEPFQ